tara:strand:- start:57 stop:311 length:255 start_codon:yes stop_codon:yes gene_type:complete
MKQLLFIIITFMFVSNVYAEDSSAHILGNGKVIYSKPSDNSTEARHGVMYIYVYYKKEMYRCRMHRDAVRCFLLNDDPVIIPKK